MILVDSQVREVEYQDVGFHFALRIITTRCWKQKLNGEASKADQLILEEKLMGSIVPHEFPKIFAADKGGKKPPVESPTDCSTVDPEDAAKQGKELTNSTEKREHYLLASPPTPGQKITNRTIWTLLNSSSLF